MISVKPALPVPVKLVSFLLLLLAATNVTAQATRSVSAETIENWMTELSNWGRWGEEDQLGTLNLITPETKIEAVKLVRTGISVSLAHNYSVNPNAQAPANFAQEISSTGADGEYVMERISFSYHGNIHSHLDSLCHVTHNGQMYNGYPLETVTENGCSKLGITDLKDGIMTRGILLDIARLKGVEYLDPGTPIYVEDLEAWEGLTGVTVGSGDIIFVRTGRWAVPAGSAQGSSGLHATVAPWLKERGVAMIGGDYANDVVPSGVEGNILPIHQLAIVSMGIRLFDNLDLEAVALEAARQNRWEFLLTAAPLPVEGGVGSPMNPIATF